MQSLPLCFDGCNRAKKECVYRLTMPVCCAQARGATTSRLDEETMKTRRYILFVAYIPCLASGCAMTSPPRSGFLGDYSGLVKQAGEQGVWVYHNPDTTYAEYQHVIIEPFQVGFGPQKDALFVNAKELHELAKYMHDSVVKIVSEHYPVVEESGKGTLRLRVALTRIEPSSGADSASAASGYMRGVALGGASFEGETCDSVTGERIHAFVASNQIRSETAADRGRWGQAKAVMDDFGRRFREELDKCHGRN